MKTFLAIIIAIALVIIGAIVHESDIYRQCVEQGNDGGAGWFIDINCSPR